VRTQEYSSGGFDAVIAYTGHVFHKNSGLHLALYRAYDADLGRWLSPDPIGEAGGMNLYGYLGGQALLYYDPNGLAPYDAIILDLKMGNLLSKVTFGTRRIWWARVEKTYRQIAQVDGLLRVRLKINRYQRLKYDRAHAKGLIDDRGHERKLFTIRDGLKTVRISRSGVTTIERER